MSYADLGPPGFYDSSSHGRTAIADMASPHLTRTIAKIKRDHGEDHPKLAELQFQLSQRGDQPQGEPGPVESKALKREGPAPIGDNSGEKPDDFLAKLEASQADLLAEIAEHEMAVIDLPKAAEIKSEEDVAKIIAWATKQKALRGQAEKARVGVKDFYLRRSRQVDGWFKEVDKTLENRLAAVQARPTAFLQARAAAETRARLAAARQAKEAADKAAAELQARLDAEAQAQAEAQAANQAILQANDDKSIVAAEEGTRAALLDAADARKATDAAAQEAADAAANAQRAERMADPSQTRQLARSQSDAGSAGIKQVPKYQITDALALNKSLGVWAAFLTGPVVNDALARASKADPWPSIPGVRFYHEDEVAITAARKS